ncbi:hypothetical protein [Exiguobacterium sp. s196]|uniref:hypothetical protein n=1 Tax=Exiguobacterium sp. s196 TaxID=2751283 RepID=UPI001BECB246|nr:hypothetical protein [Exiguobacterium sp. s196]
MDHLIDFKQEFTMQTMLHELHELIAKANRLNLDTTTIEGLYKDLNVLNLFSNRHIVSVAGLQSAGKTLVVKRMLDLPDDLLLSEVGVGEKRPVLLSSDASATTITYRLTRAIKTATGSFELKDESITKEQLNTGIQNPSGDMLWFEIILPNNHVLGHLTLALLPGFERSARSDSQKFLDIFLKCSTGMILVLNHARLAQMDQEMLLQQVASTYKDKAPGFVLTHASELTEEKRTMITQNLFQKFSMADESQIILADTDIENVPQEMERLLKSNSQFTQDSLQLHHKKLMMIGETLVRELVKLEHVLIAQSNGKNDQRELRTMQRSFDEAREKYIKELDDTLKGRLDTHVQRCIGEVTERIKKEKHTLWDKARASFKKDMTFNERDELLKSIRRVYLTENPRVLDLLMMESIETMTRKRLSLYKPHMFQSKPIEQTASKPALSFMEPKANELVPKQSELEIATTTTDIMQEAFSVTLTEVDRYLDPTVLDVSLGGQHTQQLPVIAGTIVQHLILTKGKEGDVSLVVDGIEEYETLKAKIGDMEGFHQEYSGLVLDANRMVTGTAVFFGIDALDGNFNSFGAIVGALEALGVAAGVATGVAAVGVSGAVAAIAVKRGSEKIEKFKFERHDYAKQVLQATADYQRKSTLALVNSVMDEMRAKLMHAYYARRQDDVNLGLYEEVEVRVNRLKNECGKLREEAFRNAGAIY